jgi:hypothetical protein|tara:strand:- start:952 stop:3183 length:2232 start_codon:yes stop_codon:yes gene_type:complete
MAGNTIKFLIEMRDKASGPLKKVGDAAEDAGENAKGASLKYTELASKLTLLGIAAQGASRLVQSVAKPLLAIAKGGVEAGAEMEGFETRLKVLMGSSVQAKKRLDELFKIGSTTPFELPGLMEAEVNLRALGVNAEETLPLVMDFAGAMGVDLASAAVEVGRAMQFGAGAVETISGRALRAQVELRTGTNALKMSTEEFRDAMVATLTDEDGIFAGGTQKLAATFDGMLSNLKDAFFKFKKEVGDAGLFVTAKATLETVLELLKKNDTETQNFARTISTVLVDSLFSVIDAVASILKMFAQFSIAIKTVQLAVGKIREAFFQVGLSIIQAVEKASVLASMDPLADENEQLMRDRKVRHLRKQILQMEMDFSAFQLENAQLHQEIFRLHQTTATLDEGSEKIIAEIKERSKRMQEANEAARKAAEGTTGTGTGTARGTTATTTTTTTAKKKKAKEDTGPTAEELEESMRAALLGTEAALKESLVSLRDLQYKLSPAGLAEGLVNKLTDSFGALTTMMGPAGGLVQSLSIMGREGSVKITKALRDSIKGLIVGLVEVLPKLIVSIPRAIINAVPDLIEGIFLAIPALAEAIIIGLPDAVARGLRRWFRMAIKTIEAIFFPNKQKREERKERRREAADELMAGEIGFKEAFQRFFPKTKKHTGVSHIDRTGAFLLQAGEAVIPNSGTTTQGMERRMGGRGGMNVTINTNVVDKNAIRGLGKLLEQEFSSFGRSTSPVFNSPTGTTG